MVSKLNKILSYPVSFIFYIFFFLSLVIFQPIQWICFNVFGYSAHKKSVDALNWVLLRCANILGTRFKVDNRTIIPKNAPVVIVSNHQSMWDIPPIIWYLRKYHPKFISKKSLGKGIPSISYNLKHGGSVLIDRTDRDQAIPKIKEFAHYLKKFNRGGVIFPEGTRSKDGKMHSFKPSGLLALLKSLPNGYIIPVSISNSWKLQRWGAFPIQLGVCFEMTTHPPIKISDFEIDSLVEKLETIVKSKIKG